ncbi:hypothetical protein JG687_00014849 [Phytophthora cactorum]|uniref:P-loop containing nucleoside triphosphate hydrolase n=1 Tax=Phytophthora cactorum TaxID=29920 RepID=A0A8T1U0F5_9STRA|nr:hypothetical protein JG687_00014849 [Phytophthora cactorum]
MTVHNVQGLTCDKIVFHCNSVPNLAFAYVALSRVRSGLSIMLTQPLRLEILLAIAERQAVFDMEEARVAAKVALTTANALPVVRAMQLIAQTQNRTNLPRQ